MKARKLAKQMNGTRRVPRAATQKPVQAGPTPERLRHAVEIETAADGALKGRVRIKSVLERLRDRKVITEEWYRAGEIYELHWRGAGVAEHFAAVRLDGAPGGAAEFLSDRAMRHREEYTRAVRHLGITLSRVVEDVCCRDVEIGEVAAARWNDGAQARAAGTALLCVGLEKLCNLWGMS